MMLNLGLLGAASAIVLASWLEVASALPNSEYLAVPQRVGINTPPPENYVPHDPVPSETTPTVADRSTIPVVNLTRTFKSVKDFEYTMRERSGPYTFANDPYTLHFFFSAPEDPTDEHPAARHRLVCISTCTNETYETYLDGFGSAPVSFAARRVPGSIYNTQLWFEVDPDENGHAQGLASFVWNTGLKSIQYPSRNVTKIAPIKGATDYSSTFDYIAQQLLIRCRLGDTYYFLAYDAKDVDNLDFSKAVYNFKLPALGTKSKTIRGYAKHENILYILTGNAPKATDTTLSKTEITSIDMDTLKIIQGPTALHISKKSLAAPLAQGLGIHNGGYGLTVGVVGGTGRNRQAFLFTNRELMS